MAKEMPEQAAKQSTLLPWIQRHAVLIVIESSLPLAIGLLPPVVVMILMILLPAGFLIVPFGAGYWWGSAIGRGDYDTGLRRLALLERSGLEPGAYLLKGLVLAQAGRFDEARSLCEEGLLTAKSPVVRRILLDGLAQRIVALEIWKKHRNCWSSRMRCPSGPFPPPAPNWRW